MDTELAQSLDDLQEKTFTVLRTHPDGLSEYELMQAVDLSDFNIFLQDDSNLALFRKHFVLMHCLYRLQRALHCEGDLILEISPLKVSLKKTNPQGHQEVGRAEDDSLRDYYLDWTHFDNTESEEVDQLLNNFWRDYSRYIQQDDAWEILGLPNDADRKTLVSRYRELAAVHHPDKGGEREMFIKIRAAYEVLLLSL